MLCPGTQQLPREKCFRVRLLDKVSLAAEGVMGRREGEFERAITSRLKYLCTSDAPYTPRESRVMHGNVPFWCGVRAIAK
eukprot:scaffold112_cov282-Prasinococcus_capsulatus_cf.AAC.9